MDFTPIKKRMREFEEEMEERKDDFRSAMEESEFEDFEMKLVDFRNAVAMKISDFRAEIAAIDFGTGEFSKEFKLTAFVGEKIDDFIMDIESDLDDFSMDIESDAEERMEEKWEEEWEE